MRPQKAQMPQMAEHDRLDTAIDQVAARMVHVNEDASLTERIVGALPERTSRFAWFIPRLAAMTALAVAAIVWTSRDTAPPALLPSADVAGLGGMPTVVAASAPRTVAPGTAVRTMPLESAFARNTSGELRRDRLLEPLEPLRSDGADFERSLPAIDAMTALAMSDVTPDEMPATPALMLAPIEITDLPLTAESFPPR